MAEIVARRLIEHLENVGFVICHPRDSIRGHYCPPLFNKLRVAWVELAPSATRQKVDAWVIQFDRRALSRRGEELAPN